MEDKNQIIQLAKEHFINLKTSSAMSLILALMRVEFPTTCKIEKQRRIDLVYEVVTSA